MKNRIRPSKSKIILISILNGFLLNLTGWLGNNFIFGSMWDEVSFVNDNMEWRNSIWRHVFSFVPDYVYGFAIVWLIVLMSDKNGYRLQNSVRSGIYVSVVGGITTYFAIANSGFIPWKLALASFLLVLITKIGLAIFVGKLLYK